MRIIDDGNAKILFDEDKKIRVSIAKEVLYDMERNESDISISQFYREHEDIVKKNLSDTQNPNGYFESSIWTKDFQYRGIYKKIINSNLRISCEAIEHYESISDIKFNDEEFKKWFNILDSEYSSLIYDTTFKNTLKEFKVDYLAKSLAQQIKNN